MVELVRWTVRYLPHGQELTEITFFATDNIQDAALRAEAVVQALEPSDATIKALERECGLCHKPGHKRPSRV